MSKPKKANFFVKTLRNTDPASSTLTFETQAVLRWKSIKKGQKNIVHSVLSWVSFKTEILNYIYKMPKYVLSLDVKGKLKGSPPSDIINRSGVTVCMQRITPYSTR